MLVVVVVVVVEEDFVEKRLVAMRFALTVLGIGLLVLGSVVCPIRGGGRGRRVLGLERCLRLLDRRDGRTLGLRLLGRLIRGGGLRVGCRPDSICKKQDCELWSKGGVCGFFRGRMLQNLHRFYLLRFYQALCL